MTRDVFLLTWGIAVVWPCVTPSEELDWSSICLDLALVIGRLGVRSSAIDGNTILVFCARLVTDGGAGILELNCSSGMEVDKTVLRFGLKVRDGGFLGVESGSMVSLEYVLGSDSEAGGSDVGARLEDDEWARMEDGAFKVEVFLTLNRFVSGFVIFRAARVCVAGVGAGVFTASAGAGV